MFANRQAHKDRSLGTTTALQKIQEKSFLCSIVSFARNWFIDHRNLKPIISLLKCFSNSFLQVVAWSAVLIRTLFYHISRIARLISAIKTATMMKYMTGCCRFTIDGAIIVNRWNIRSSRLFAGLFGDASAQGCVRLHQREIERHGETIGRGIYDGQRAAPSIVNPNNSRMLITMINASRRIMEAMGRWGELPRATKHNGYLIAGISSGGSGRSIDLGRSVANREWNERIHGGYFFFPRDYGIHLRKNRQKRGLKMDNDELKIKRQLIGHRFAMELAKLMSEITQKISVLRVNVFGARKIRAYARIATSSRRIRRSN